MSICIYHDSCPDGIASAWIVQKAIPDIELFGGRYGGELPIVAGKKTYFVDFCYDADIMKQMAENASELTVIDHHKTAQKAIDMLRELPQVSVCWDLTQSGCQLAWKHFFSEIPEPIFLTHIADRDLWKWSNKNSKPFVSGYMHKYKLNIETMELLSKLTTDEYWSLVDLGKTVLEMEEHTIKWLCSSAVLREWQGYSVWFCESTIYRSDIGAKLALREEGDFALVWRYNMEKDEVWISLRGSNEKGIDLTPLAQKYGGGGHPNACGFAVKGSIQQLWV